MRETRTSGSMSGDGKRGDGHRPPATAPIFDSTAGVVFGQVAMDARSPPYLADSDDVGQRPEMGHNPPFA